MWNSIPNNIGAVILAAGRGTRLNSVDRPKVMLEIGGKPMVRYIVETLQRIGFAKEQIVLVVGFQKEKVMEYFGDTVTYAIQTEQKGTAHAAHIGITQLSPTTTTVLVLGGDDSAFYEADTLKQFIADHESTKSVLSLLTVEVNDPAQYGRVVRHNPPRIIEKEYLTEAQKQITEISTGTFCFDRAWFEEIFPRMPLLRKLGEYGLPTALAMAADENANIQLVKLTNPNEWFGVNTPAELEEARRRKNI